MKKIKWIFPIFILLLFTGCYNYRELNQLALISAIGIDKTDNGYKVTVQVLNTQKQGSNTNSSGDQPKFIVYQQEAETIQKAIRQVIFESPRRLYVHHMNLLLLSESVAEDSMNEILDFFSRNAEFRKQFLVALAREDKAENILETLTPLESLNAKNIQDSIMADVKFLGMSTKVTFEDLLKSYLNDKTDMVLPSIEVVGNEKKEDEQDNIKSSNPSATVVLMPLGVFQENHFVGYLTKNQSRVVNYIRGNTKNSIITYNCSENDKISIEIVTSKTKLDLDTQKPKITIFIKGSGNIKEIACDVDLTKPKTITELENIINTNMQKEIVNDVNDIINTYHADIFNFEDTIYKNSPKAYKELKNKYGDKLLDQIEIDAKVDIKLLTKGNVVRVIKR